jgi:hypothetical protein
MAGFVEIQISKILYFIIFFVLIIILLLLFSYSLKCAYFIWLTYSCWYRDLDLGLQEDNLLSLPTNYNSTLQQLSKLEDMIIMINCFMRQNLNFDSFSKICTCMVNKLIE